MQRYFRMPAILLAGMLLVGFVVGVGCKHNDDGNPDATKTVDPTSLYARLGGHDAIKAVVDDFVKRAASDPKVNFDRKNPTHPNQWEATPDNVDKLKKHLVQFITEATGGPKSYHGKSMEAVHQGMEISNAEFDAAAADLKASLESLKVPENLQNELMTIVGSTRSQMVGK